MNHAEIEADNSAVLEAGAFVQPLMAEMGKVIVGQKYLLERLVISLLADGHVLLEGVPGTQAGHDLLKRKAATNRAAILCGHVHFAHTDVVQPGWQKYVTAPGCEGGYRFIELTGLD